MTLRPGDIGKFVRDYVPEFILFGTKLRDWYDSNPYRQFDGRSEDAYGREIKKDVLVLKNNNSCFADARPVVVVNGCANISKNKRRVYVYDITVHFDINKACDELNDDESVDNIVVSSDGKRASMSQEILKSNLEKNYRRFSTVKEASPEILENAVKYYASKVDKKFNDATLIQDISYLFDLNSTYNF